MSSVHKSIGHFKIARRVFNAIAQTAAQKPGSHGSEQTCKEPSHILLITSTISKMPYASRSLMASSWTGRGTPISVALDSTCARTSERDSFKIQGGSQAAGTVAAVCA